MQPIEARGGVSRRFLDQISHALALYGQELHTRAEFMLISTNRAQCVFSMRERRRGEDAYLAIGHRLHTCRYDTRRGENSSIAVKCVIPFASVTHSFPLMFKREAE